MSHNQLYERQSQVLTSKGSSKQNFFLSQSNQMSKSQNKIIYQQRISKTDELRHTLTNLQQNNLVAQSMLQEWPSIKRNKQVLCGIQVLKDIQLLQDKSITMNELKGKHRVNFIYNDYHQKNTNPGYSRNNLGCLYTR